MGCRLLLPRTYYSLATSCTVQRGGLGYTLGPSAWVDCWCYLHVCLSLCVCVQLLRKVGFSTPKTYAMFRPVDMTVSKTPHDTSAAPATVTERHNLGWHIKYNLRFDDDVVRTHTHTHMHTHAKHLSCLRIRSAFVAGSHTVPALRSLCLYVVVRVHYLCVCACVCVCVCS